MDDIRNIPPLQLHKFLNHAVGHVHINLRNVKNCYDTIVCGVFSTCADKTESVNIGIICYLIKTAHSQKLYKHSSFGSDKCVEDIAEHVSPLTRILNMQLINLSCANIFTVKTLHELTQIFSVYLTSCETE